MSDREYRTYSIENASGKCMLGVSVRHVLLKYYSMDHSRYCEKSRCTHIYSEFRRTSNSVSHSGLRDGKFMVGKVQWFYIATYGKKQTINFSLTQTGTGYRIRSSPEFTVVAMNSSIRIIIMRYACIIGDHEILHF